MLEYYTIIDYYAMVCYYCHVDTEFPNREYLENLTMNEELIDTTTAPTKEAA